jgi:hypothetical protein
MLLFGNFGRGRSQVQLMHRRTTGQALNGMRSPRRPCRRSERKMRQSVGNALVAMFHLFLCLD